MSKKVEGLILKVTDERKEVKVIHFESFKDLYPMMHCDLIEVVGNVNIEGGTYDLLVDEEGLFKEGNVISGLCENVEQQLVGNLVITKSNYLGEFVSLNDEDYLNISKHLHAVMNRETSVISPIIMYKHKV